MFYGVGGGEAHLWCACRRERDSSGTTRDRMKCGAGDGADSPTRGASAARDEAARPNALIILALN